MANDRLNIEYDLTFATPFHFGTGIREGVIDRTVVRDDGGYQYVPGSTIKGVLRERCEQLARLYDQPGIASPHNAPGKLFIDDARQASDDLHRYDSGEPRGDGKYRSLQVDVSTLVRLDRPTRTAVEGALYTSEFGSKDIAFKGTILGWLECTPIDTNTIQAETGQSPSVTPTYSLLLLLAGLQMLEWIGGNKSTAKGHCMCTIVNIQINDVEVGADIWKSWFKHIDKLTNYSRAG
jgi:CRISPR/Cas system CMR subunit Cmr4 (Cas7 group RAMP superfamily)